jgi:hypothetical protein
MPKGVASVGDGLWHRRVKEIPQPLRAYMAQDVSQSAALAWVLTACWIMQIFPDAHAVSQVSTMTPPQLVKWWHCHVIEELVTSTPRTDPWEIKASRREMMESLSGGRRTAAICVETLADWPSVTAGGARYVHTVRNFLLSCLPVLRAVEEEKWPVLQKEQYHLVRFGRVDIEAQPSPVGPVRSSSFVLNPGVGPSLSGPGYEITRGDLQRITGGGATAKGVLLEYIRLNPGGGRELLEYVEQGIEYGRQVFGYNKKCEEFVGVIGRTLEVYGMMPERQPGWVDPYPIQERVRQRVLRITDAALGMARHHKEKAQQLVTRAQELKATAKAAKRKMPDYLDHHFPLLNLVTPRAGEITLMPTSDALKLGERGPAQHHGRTQQSQTSTPKRQRMLERAEPAETTTSGAWEREQCGMIRRTVNLAVRALTSGIHSGLQP